MFPLEKFSVEYIKELLQKEYYRPQGNIKLGEARDIL